MTVPITISEWKRQRVIYRNDKASEFERGFAAFFLNRTNVSGVMNANPIGGMHQAGEYKINARFNRKALAEKVRAIGRFASKITVTKKDGLDVLGKYLGKPNTFIYLDPPYYKMGSMLYMNAFGEKKHIELSKILNKNRSSKWVLTYDENFYIRSLYPKMRRNRMDYNYRIRESRKARELVVTPMSLRRPCYKLI